MGHDHTSADDVRELQAAIWATLNELAQIRPSFAKARSVIQYDSDRRKAALSRAVVDLPNIKAVQMAEHHARCSEGYEKTMETLKGQYEHAEGVVGHYFELKAKLEALRSLLSTEKELIKEV